MQACLAIAGKFTNSAAAASLMLRVFAVLQEYCSMPRRRIGVVVSAMGGMTDALLNLAALAEQADDAYDAELQCNRRALRRHRERTA